MRSVKFFAPLALLLAVPCLAFSATVSTFNHTQVCSFCGDNVYYHADLNNDGREDLVYVFQPIMGLDGSFDVKLSNRDGTYAAPVRYQIPLRSGSSDAIGAFTLGDFNHDGKIDIAAFSYEGFLYIYLNNGAGAFTLGTTTTFAPANGAVSNVSATVGDFNHDGLSDLAYILNGQLNVWFGNGKGGFTAGPAMGVNGLMLMMGDFDGDGLADLLVYYDPAAYNTAYVLYGDGAGHFPKTVTLTASGSFVSFNEGDVNSDGKMDVIATNNTKNVAVFYGDFSRQFASRAAIPTGRCAVGGASAADMDGNGINDLIVQEDDCNNLNAGTLFVDVLTRNANGSYNADQTLYWSQPGTDGIVHGIKADPLVLHADRNSKPDLFVQQCADQGCYTAYNTVQLNTTSGSFRACDAPAAASGVNVCTPSGTTAVASPVRFQVGASGPVIMRDVEVWVDGKKLAQQRYGFSYYTYLDSSVSLTPGAHHVDVYGAGWDQSTVKTSLTVNVQ